MKEIFNFYVLPPFFVKSLRLDSFSRKKLWHYLQGNTSFLEMFIGNCVIISYIVSMVLVCLFGCIYSTHLPEQIQANNNIFVGLGLSSFDSFNLLFYGFILISSVVFGFAVMMVEYYEKYIIKYPFVVLIGMLERAKKYEFAIIMFFFAIMILKGWTMQSISLLFFLYLKMETRRTMIGCLRIRVVLLYSHLSYKELKKFLGK